jgi:phage terminase Nu1 subunit (DNA packaging protein)
MTTQADIARGLNVSPALVTRYKRAGMPTTSVEAAAAWKAAHVRQRIDDASAKANGKPRVNAHQPSAYQDARTRWAISEAEERELSVLERKAALVRREVVRSEMARILVGLRQSLLQVPARLQSVLAAESDEIKVHDILQDEMDQILTQVAEYAQ